MGLFENFPYTNFQNLNLDYLLKTVKNLNDSIDQKITAEINNILPKVMLKAYYNPDTRTISFEEGNK